MEPLISVIVPVYNTAKYLDKCLLSILDQRYKNMEIILVDDGSTDLSPQICDSYAKKDHRVIVIHKPNGGQSSARNVGLDACHGEYISFIDSDDWIEPDMYTTMVAQLEQYNANLAICSRFDAYENSDTKKVGKRLGRNGLFAAYDIFPLMVLGQLSDFSVCDKLHSRELWENTRFPEGVIYEDFAIMYQVVLTAGNVVLCDTPFYVYHHRSGSTVTSEFSESLIDYPNHTKKFLIEMTETYPEFTNHAIWAHIKAIQAMLIKLMRSDRNTYKRYGYVYDIYIQDVVRYQDVWRSCSLFSLVDRLICEILLYGKIARLLFVLKRRA